PPAAREQEYASCLLITSAPPARFTRFFWLAFFALNQDPRESPPSRSPRVLRRCPAPALPPSRAAAAPSRSSAPARDPNRPASPRTHGSPPACEKALRLAAAPSPSHSPAIADTLPFPPQAHRATAAPAP